MRRLHNFDPIAAWPDTLVKEYPDSVAEELLRFPYWVEITEDSTSPSPDDFRHMRMDAEFEAAEKLAAIHQGCQSCREKRERERIAQQLALYGR